MTEHSEQRGGRGPYESGAGSGARLTRRTFVTGAGVAVAPRHSCGRGGQAPRARSSSGPSAAAYEEAVMKAIFEPFTKATGIEIVKAPATLGKVLAMFEAGDMELDVDGRRRARHALAQPEGRAREDQLQGVEARPTPRTSTTAATTWWPTSTSRRSSATTPRPSPPASSRSSWAEFWDLKKFPGPRMLTDLAAGAIDLEFALLADGVPKDKLYPIDVDRAFKSLDRVRPAIRKFWDTGALSAQMLADKEVVLGSDLERAAAGHRRQGRAARHRVERGHAPDAVLGRRSRARRTPRTPSASSSSPASRSSRPRSPR